MKYKKEKERKRYACESLLMQKWRYKCIRQKTNKIEDSLNHCQRKLFNIPIWGKSLIPRSLADTRIEREVNIFHSRPYEILCMLLRAFNSHLLTVHVSYIDRESAKVNIEGINKTKCSYSLRKINNMFNFKRIPEKSLQTF